MSSLLPKAACMKTGGARGGILCWQILGGGFFLSTMKGLPLSVVTSMLQSFKNAELHFPP
jgi:hypothetical protein